MVNQISNKVHFVSLGCSRNLVDSEVMLGLLMSKGYEIIPDMELADFLVVNTCGFLESARDESSSVIEELFDEKKDDAKVIVTGCMVQRHQDILKERFPNIHYFLGSGDVEGIIGAIESESAGESIGSARSYLEKGEVPRQLSTPSHYAYLKIAEGCAKRCAFCIIPLIKGKLQSKPVDRVVSEFKGLLDRGVFEVILIAQDLGDYGKDRREKGALAALIRDLLKDKRDFWLRFLYLYPDEIDDELIELMKSDKRICPYLDMPIQHVNNKILKAMRRKTSGDDIKKTINTLRKEIPSIVIRTSLMVGFPGETEEDFEELCQFVKEYKLDNVGLFTYSNEDKALSAKLSGHVPENIKQRRFKRIAQIQKRLVKKRNEKYIGKTLDVVVEGYHPETDLLMRGRFYGQCPEIDGQILINDGRGVSEFGSLYQVKITDVADYDLVGSVTGSSKK